MRSEHVWYTPPQLIRSLFRRSRVERELHDELQLHLDHLIEEGVASGLSPREARNAALRTMGGGEQQKEEMRDMRGVRWFTDFVDHVRYALRTLRRSRALTLFV